MARYQHNVYSNTKTPRYIVLFDLQWKIIECQHLKPAADLSGAMTAAMQRLTEEGWQPESAPRFGFVFLNRNGARQLLILTERDPRESGSPAFSPFR